MNSEDTLYPLIMLHYLKLSKLTALATAAMVCCVCRGYCQTTFDPANGLAAYFSFSGNGIDGSGHGHHSTLVGSSFGSDRFGAPASAILLTGQESPESKVLLPANIPLTADFTVSAWVRFSGGTFSPRIFSGGRYEIGTEGTGDQRRFYLVHGCALSGQAAFTTNTFPALTWIHVVGRRIGEDDSLFINGTVAATGFAVSKPDCPIESATEIGGNLTGEHDAFGGLIDEVRIYSRALSDKEVAALYRIESRPPESLTIRVKTVRVAMNLIVGKTYQLESSQDLLNWEPIGSQFVAEFPEIERDFEVLEAGQYFRLKPNSP